MEVCVTQTLSQRLRKKDGLQIEGNISTNNRWKQSMPQGRQQDFQLNNMFQLRAITLPFGGIWEFTQLLIFHVKDTGEGVLQKE